MCVNKSPATLEQRRVEPVLVVGGEDEDPLMATAGLQAVHHIDQSGQSDLTRQCTGYLVSDNQLANHRK